MRADSPSERPLSITLKHHKTLLKLSCKILTSHKRLREAEEEEEEVKSCWTNRKKDSFSEQTPVRCAVPRLGLHDHMGSREGLLRGGLLKAIFTHTWSTEIRPKKMFYLVLVSDRPCQFMCDPNYFMSLEKKKTTQKTHKYTIQHAGSVHCCCKKKEKMSYLSLAATGKIK